MKRSKIISHNFLKKNLNGFQLLELQKRSTIRGRSIALDGTKLMVETDCRN